MIDFNARHFMEMAIEIMRKSIPERRSDGKASPKVGAVLLEIGDKVPSRDRITTAFRGELREGDHAEYTLLERKSRDQSLDGCVLFATLEPCAPNARKFPKLGCAERIVLARIKEVWIGIEDPDPTVDRKGIKYLQDNGVIVHMFDRDLQEVILAENKEFIDQALERAAAVEEKPTEISLSPLEHIATHSQLDDLSPEAMEQYRVFGKLSEEIDSSQFKSRLVRQGLLKFDRDRFVPTGFGLVLFGKEPRVAMPQSVLLGTIHFPDGTEEARDFDGPQVLVPTAVLEWLKDKLPNVMDRSEAKRRDRRESLFELVREGVVNALVHRDYGIRGAKCQLKVFSDKIEILSPGKPVRPITVAQLQSFDAPMLSRNPALHYVFAKMELAEERGLGLKSMRARTEKAGLPLPRYAWIDPYLSLTLFTSAAAATTTLPPQIQKRLSSAERAGWQWMSRFGRATSAEYAAELQVDIRTARRHLQHMMELGLIQRVGSGPATRFEIK